MRGPFGLPDTINMARCLMAALQEVHDQGVRSRSALEREDLLHGGGVLRVGAQPVDRLGRKCHDLATTQSLHGRVQFKRCRPDRSGHGVNTNRDWDYSSDTRSQRPSTRRNS